MAQLDETRRLQTEFLATIKQCWWRYMGGQFWVGGWSWYGDPASASFFVDELGLEMDHELEVRARAYWATSMAACWWWPHRDFVIVSEQPTTLTKSDGKHGQLVECTFADGWSVKR